MLNVLFLGYKKYECTDCGRLFALKSYLNKHYDQHSCRRSSVSTASTQHNPNFVNSTLASYENLPSEEKPYLTNLIQDYSSKIMTSYNAETNIDANANLMPKIEVIDIEI